jgi:hypothetical protein
MGTTGGNRLTQEEQQLLEAVRRWFGYRTPENLRRMTTAAKNWIKADLKSQKERTV